MFLSEDHYFLNYLSTHPSSVLVGNTDISVPSSQMQANTSSDQNGINLLVTVVRRKIKPLVGVGYLGGTIPQHGNS